MISPSSLAPLSSPSSLCFSPFFHLQLAELLQSAGQRLDRVFYFDVPDAVLSERISAAMVSEKSGATASGKAPGFFAAAEN